MTDERTTLGRDLFRSRDVGDIRFALEEKFLGCLLLGNADYLLPPDWLKVADHRTLYCVWRYCRDAEPSAWLELAPPFGDMAGAAMLDCYHARFGRDDVAALHAIRRLELLEHRAAKGGLLT